MEIPEKSDVPYGAAAARTHAGTVSGRGRPRASAMASAYSLKVAGVSSTTLYTRPGLPCPSAATVAAAASS
ncbi:hypothetical protein ACX80N_05150 [Arthrobacter sp. MDT2-16]